MITNDGRIFYELVPAPAPSVIEKPLAVPGAKAACQALGLPTFRTFKLTAPGDCPIYEEVETLTV